MITDELEEVGLDPAFNILSDEIVHTRDASIVKLIAVIDGDVLQFDGTARRSPTDQYDQTTATLLATARAYQALGNKLMKRAQARINQADHNQSIRPAQKAAKERWERMKEQEKAKSSPVFTLVSREPSRTTQQLNPADLGV